MLIPTWTASSESEMSPGDSAEPSKKPTGPEFGLGDGTVCLNHPGASSPPHGVSGPFADLQEKIIYKKFMLLSSIDCNDSRRKMY